MATLDKRLTVLEFKQALADFSGMIVDELNSHLGTLKAGSLEWFRVILTGIWRTGSRLPISSVR